MSELKTLKDLAFPCGCAKPILRQEAIKRFRSYNTFGFRFRLGPDGKVLVYEKKKKKLNSIDFSNLGAMIELINFCNLTEGDLK